MSAEPVSQILKEVSSTKRPNHETTVAPESPSCENATQGAGKGVPVSHTPRTDKVFYDSQPGHPLVPNGCFVVSADFARTLERENTALTAKLERAERELQGATERIEKLECVLREDIISASIIHAENEQRGHIHAIRRDAKFIKERCQAALQPAADGAAEGVGKA